MVSEKARIYAGNLSEEVDSRDLHDFFRRYGHVEEARVIRDFETGKSKGFGFVQFTREEDAAAAVQDKGKYTVKGQVIRVGYARKKKIEGKDEKENA